MNQDAQQEKLLEYLQALEAVNQQLLTALKRCVEVLAQIKPSAPDQKGWQAMLDDIENIIRAVEKVYQEKTIH